MNRSTVSDSIAAIDTAKHTMAEIITMCNGNKESVRRYINKHGLPYKKFGDRLCKYCHKPLDVQSSNHVMCGSDECRREHNRQLAAKRYERKISQEQKKLNQLTKRRCTFCNGRLPLGRYFYHDKCYRDWERSHNVEWLEMM